MTLSSAQERRLAAVLGRPVPGEYLELLRKFPVGLYENLSAQGLDREQPLFRDASTVIQENLLAREEDIWTEEGPWPADHLMIGAEMGGDKFTLSASRKSPGVFRLNHETATLERIGTFGTYLAAVRRWLRGEAETITSALDKPSSKKGKASKKKEPPWVTKRRKMAAQAPAQERKAKKTNAPTDWGDAAVFYEAANRIPDALRCCDQWIARSPKKDEFPRSFKVRLLALLVNHEAGLVKKPELAGQYRELFEDRSALHAAHIAAAKAALAVAEKSKEPGARAEARAELALAKKAAKMKQRR